MFYLNQVMGFEFCCDFIKQNNMTFKLRFYLKVAHIKFSFIFQGESEHVDKRLSRQVKII